MAKRREHADLRNLRLWIDRIASDYEKAHPHQWDSHKENLHSVRRAIDGEPKGSSKDALRGLVATGIIQYKDSALETPKESLPETLMLDFIVDALWPIVIAPELPESWFDSLAELTSPQLASFVAYSRSAGDSMDKRAFYSGVARTSFAGGIRNLLIDLSSPHGGGSYLATIAIAGGSDVPPKGSTSKDLLRWIFRGLAGAAIGGVIGNRADDLVVHLWNWLTENAAADEPVLAGESGNTSTVDLGGPSAVPSGGAPAATSISASAPSGFPGTAIVGKLTHAIGTKGFTAAVVAGTAAAAIAVIAGVGVGDHQTNPVPTLNPALGTVSPKTDLAVPSSPGSISETMPGMPARENPENPNNPSIKDQQESSGNPTIIPSTSTNPPTTIAPSTTVLVAPRHADLTGTWRLDFKRTNFGNQGVVQPYTIALDQLDDSKCEREPPCYGGVWYNVEASRYEGGSLVATAVQLAPSLDEFYEFYATEDPDYPGNGKQEYIGRGVEPNDATSFTGDWTSRAADGYQRTATFIFTFIHK